MEKGKEWVGRGKVGVRGWGRQRTAEGVNWKQRLENLALFLHAAQAELVVELILRMRTG